MDFVTLKRQFGHSELVAEGRRSSEEFEQYDRTKPSHQNALDLVPGWTGMFPAEDGVSAGHLALYADPRIAWAIERSGGLEGKTILEVGPMEGMHTYMLNRERPSRIDAIESNKLCYLRCLITDQIMNIDRAKFYLGDVMKWLEDGGDRYDLIVGSGVLYHMQDPIKFLELCAARSDSLFLWTHYFSDTAMQKKDVRRRPFTGRVETRHSHGLDLSLHERGYNKAARDASFCGGPRNRHYWMQKQDILDLLSVLGFDTVEIGDEDEAHSGGPCMSLFARRS